MVISTIVNGFNNYRIYTDGRFSVTKNGIEKFLKGSKQSGGYTQVTLIDGKIRSRMLTHRLVAIHFIPNPHDYPHINHKDNDITNNNIDNLEWVTPKMNAEWRDIQGRGAKGVDVGSVKLTEKEVLSIRFLLKNKRLLQKNIAKLYNVTPGLVTYIKQGKIWGHL